MTDEEMNETITTSTVKGVLRELTGIENSPYPEADNDRHVLLTGLINPPTYFVYMLMKLTGFTCYDGAEKSVWEVYLKYKAIHFSIRDHKSSTWSIDAMGSSLDIDKAKKIAEELKRRIEKAGEKLDGILEPYLNTFIERNEFYLQNSYHQLRTLYDFHFEHTQDTVRQANETSAKASEHWHWASNQDDQRLPTVQHYLDEWASIWNQTTKLEQVAGYYASSMVSFFFSYTELLIDIMFILRFHDPVSSPWNKFRNNSWRVRFKRVFPIAKDPILSRIYEKLLEIRGNWRNVLLHGFRDEIAYLIAFPHVGIVPMSYINATKAIHFSLWPSQEKIKYALSTFEAFDEWIQRHDQYLYAVLYAQSGLPIPLEQNRLREVRQWMVTPEVFSEMIDIESNRQQEFLDHYQ